MDSSHQSCSTHAHPGKPGAKPALPVLSAQPHGLRNGPGLLLASELVPEYRRRNQDQGEVLAGPARQSLARRRWRGWRPRRGLVK